MQKLKLAEDILLYQFDPKPGKHFGFNIIALINGSRVILIDTAFESQALQVLEDLNRHGLEIEKVILSHFHNDHIFGLKALPRVPVYGSRHYQITLDKWTRKEEHRFFIPDIPVEKPQKIDFGQHRLTLIPFPGHSDCGMLVNINDRWLHVGDELIFSNAGEPILPSIDYSSVKMHEESLRKLKDCAHLTFIPGHGRVIQGEENIQKEIDSRHTYLNAILSSKEKITFEEATKDCHCAFLHREWHEYVYA